MPPNTDSPCDIRNELKFLIPQCFNVTTPNKTCNEVITFYRLFTANCYITKVFYPTVFILIVVGTILNLFSLYCFLKMKKRNSQNVYLSVLSLGDTINLHLNFTIPLLRKIDAIDDWILGSKQLCQANGFLTEFFLIFPTWIVVLLTLERLISIIWPLKRNSLCTQKRAKISIIILAVIVFILSIYRLFDLKGIDQVSVFALAASSQSTNSFDRIRNFNLVIWAILPECLTLIMNLLIIYEIKLTTQKLESFYPKARMTKFNQATKTVLLISILFLVFHTPTGATIAIHLISQSPTDPHATTFAMTVLYVSRKFTVILYEISISCKFFIYNQTFRNFRNILHTSISRFTRRRNSAKLGRHIHRTHSIHFHLFSPQANRTHHPTHRTCHFSHTSRKIVRTGLNDNLIQGNEENYATIKNRTARKSSSKTSTSTSKASREPQHSCVIIVKTTDETRVSTQETPKFARRYTTGQNCLTMGDCCGVVNHKVLYRHRFCCFFSPS